MHINMSRIYQPPAPLSPLVLHCCLQDNGSGMPHTDIPDMLGRVLSGTKYGVKQTRGEGGLLFDFSVVIRKYLWIQLWDVRAAQSACGSYDLSP